MDIICFSSATVSENMRETFELVLVSSCRLESTRETAWEDGSRSDSCHTDDTHGVHYSQDDDEAGDV